MKPHKHAEVIKAWADGASIEYFDSDDGEWATLPTLFFWSEDCQYRIKLAEPEKVYPETKMSEDELAMFATWTENEVMREVANAAIRRAIDDGQVVIADFENTWKAKANDEWIEKTDWVQMTSSYFSFSTVGMHRADVMKREIELLRSGRDARDLAIAMAVRNYIRNFGILHDFELKSVISGVK